MGERHTVLVVDDDAAIRLLCRLNLELDGFRALEADSLAAARAVLAAEPVDVVLLDVHVGGEDGRAFLDELRRTHSGLPVAMLTGDSAASELRQAGADAVIGKPFTIDDLRDTVSRLAGAG